MSNNVSNRTGILAFVPDLYESYPMSRHHILRGLSETWPVLWVSPPLYWQPTLKDRSVLKERGLHKVSDNLWSYAPRIPADYAREYSEKGIAQRAFRFYARCWDRLFSLRVRSLARRMGIDRVILYLWRPEFGKYVEQIPHDLLCYHIVDEYSFNPEQDEPVSGAERDLLETADLVFIHSKTLMSKKGHINPNTHQVPNGVDFALYRRVIDQGLREPADLAAIPHPRIGYMGHIKRHLDLPLLLEISKSRPDWQLVMIGPVRENHDDIREDVAALKRQPNVHFLGGKQPTELPRYVNGFDVGIMPYRQTNYTKYIYPLKMHEYFACGIPVVSTRLENLLEFSDVLTFAKGADGWMAAIDKVRESTTEQQRIKLIKTASENSWADRVQRIKDLIKNS